MLERKLTAAQFQDLAREVLARDSLLQFRARGGSMRPFIRDQDLIEVAPLSGEQARRGQVVVFELDGRLLVHRVVSLRQGKDGMRLLVQGDALLYPDGWIQPKQVFGRVVALQRSGRWQRLDTPARRWLAAWSLFGLTLLKGGLRGARRLLRSFKGRWLQHAAGG
jgi:hypothetical protein